MTVKFDLNNQDRALINKIMERMGRLKTLMDLLDTPFNMSRDITACHLNGCPLDLAKLMAADDNAFMHDVLGIERHLDRKRGKLLHYFLPKCSSKLVGKRGKTAGSFGGYFGGYFGPDGVWVAFTNPYNDLLDETKGMDE